MEGLSHNSASTDASVISSIMLAGISRIAPPNRMRVSEAAEKYATVISAGGASGWDASIAPYMIEPMDLLSSRRHEAVIFVGPARTGKSMALLDCWLTYILTCDPGDTIFYFSSENNAKDFSGRRLRKLHENSKVLGDLLSTRSHDNNICTTIYRNGMILSLGWPTSSQLSQRDARYVGISDYDSIADNIDGEGAAFDLAKKRVQTMMSAGMAMVESSPKRVITHPDWRAEHPHDAPPVDGGILLLYQRGDRRRWYWQCLHCGAWFEAPAIPEYDDLGDIEKSVDTARVVCRGCGAIHEPQDKRLLQLGGPNNHPGIWVPAGCAVDANGILTGEAVRSPIASFWVKGCAAGFQQWHSLVRNHLNAIRVFEKTGMENELITTTHQDQGMPYLPKRLGVTRDALDLLNRVEYWPKREIPKGVRYLTAAVDIQGNRFVVQVVGWGAHGERWLVDRYNLRWSTRLTGNGEPEPVNPGMYPEDWDVIITEVVHKAYPLSWDKDRGLKPMLVAVDSGGADGVTDRAYKFWKKCFARGLGSRVILVKGDAKGTGPRIHKSYPDSTGRKDRQANARGEIPVYLLNTLILKDALAADLDRPGYIHFPQWLGKWFFDELTAEVRTASGWEPLKRGERNEAFDLFVYNAAINLILGADKINWDFPPAWTDVERVAIRMNESVQGVIHDRPTIRKPTPRTQSDSWGL